MPEYMESRRLAPASTYLTMEEVVVDVDVEEDDNCREEFFIFFAILLLLPKKQ